MQSRLHSRMLGKWLMICACLISCTVIAQGQVALDETYKKTKSVFQQNDVQSLGNLLKQIERNHNVSFVCRSEILNVKVDISEEDFTGSSFVETLQKVLKSHNLKVKRISKQQFAISYIKESNNGYAHTSYEEGENNSTDKIDYTPNGGTSVSVQREYKLNIQNKTVTGIVTSRSTGDPLRGVSVSVKGTSIGTTTNDEGRYSINVPNENDVLVFSYVGFVSIERSVANQTQINVALEDANRAMNEVVVVGYGTQRKVNLTGAVSAVTAEDLKGRPITATSTGLQGLLPGVTIRSFSAMPGQTGSSIRIRGIGTLGDSNPLIVIDGIPGGNMDILNPDDIESISVLKDAASSSIYGVRGANGVILITTKKGRADSKPAITYSNYVGYQTPTALPKFLGSPE
ncbi:MAG TPA: carboxypeptidase-like regulatory domain-containing protein, partial [Flavisolibacter sp.]|nr:carboxypeptidase-like regulatory domain-containing protein [Flavisolibacter sp.]